ncbi:Very-short-patch-repair endonuclease [Sinosporangium album]|uniref:Very-short-patch-repair endonuclease n=1 Tax=Sinosporangium album TaxID=504805 RepID=A0A1G7T428_9ACTN|nr:DUF559 domain-containing protein [Sinosporangium album]SDG29991.1 Very-short-patch-repair endonuclease [Sinosporangium album]
MGRVVCLHGVPAVPPDGLPAVVTCAVGAPRSPLDTVTALLHGLEEAAFDLFPAWLPDARGISGPGGAGVAAVRAAATRTARRNGHFSPFLADLAERALRRTAWRTPRFPLEVRAVGLARVLAAGFGRSHASALVHVPGGLSPSSEEHLVAGCEWLARHGGLGVWLTGAPLTTVDRVLTVTLATLTSGSGNTAVEEKPSADLMPPLHPPLFPPVAGAPHPASAAEQALEAALLPRRWAAGRAWNQTYLPHPLAEPIRVDLMWAAERCVVEVDGPDHCAPPKYAADRRRDVRLHLDDHVVLRFTNEQVLTDIEIVVHQIERLLRLRRLGKPEG